MPESGMGGETVADMVGEVVTLDSVGVLVAVGVVVCVGEDVAAGLIDCVIEASVSQ